MENKVDLNNFDGVTKNEQTINGNFGKPASNSETLTGTAAEAVAGAAEAAQATYDMAAELAQELTNRMYDGSEIVLSKAGDIRSDLSNEGANILTNEGNKGAHEILSGAAHMPYDKEEAEKLYEPEYVKNVTNISEAARNIVSGALAAAADYGDKVLHKTEDFSEKPLTNELYTDDIEPKSEHEHFEQYAEIPKANGSDVYARVKEEPVEFNSGIKLPGEENRDGIYGNIIVPGNTQDELEVKSFLEVGYLFVVNTTINTAYLVLIKLLNDKAMSDTASANYRTAESPIEPHNRFESKPRPPTPPKLLDDEPVKPTAISVGPPNHKPSHVEYPHSILKHGRESLFSFRSLDPRNDKKCRDEGQMLAEKKKIDQRRAGVLLILVIDS
uniref:Senescence domain-containing protein n=1 Tax=Syphacia muris TaxID=451379 RepID=A0A158R3V5_9BILA